MGKTIREEKREKRAEFFFGKGNYTRVNKNEILYRPVIDNDNIILLTRNVRRVFVGDNSTSFVLATSSHRGVYLKSWQVMRVVINDKRSDERAICFLVKLTRKYFKTYSFKNIDIIDRDEDLGGFLEINTESNPDFDTMLSAAFLQAKEKNKVEICA